VTEYFKEYPPHSSKKFAEQARLLDRYLLPRFGERWLSGVQTEEWFEMIEAAALERQADGINLHKSLKAFNNYAIRRKLRKVNPLAKTTPDSLSIRHLSSLNAGFLNVDRLCAIYEAAQKLGPPWGPPLGLAIHDVGQLGFAVAAKAPIGALGVEIVERDVCSLMRLGCRGDDAGRRAILQPVEEELAARSGGSFAWVARASL
jgi:hypothetical protein